MRIQHNIMAMNAYRNYNTNTSALSSNLEKLSSGYKINRAGDDAAGLAISEKMRAQITGLEAAQKNVKDGISLVKTGEGAMQEIQDMLNRMDYLATQSANGTYDNDVDRANLQKEVDALKAEIDRIADSANFNGIKLLDGSLETGGTSTPATTDITFLKSDATDQNNSVQVHKVGVTGVDAGFTIDSNQIFSSLKASASIAANGTFAVTLTVGGTTITLKATATSAIAAGGAIDFSKLNVTCSATAITLTDANGNSYDFKIASSNGVLTFTKASSQAQIDFDANMAISYEGDANVEKADNAVENCYTQKVTLGVAQKNDQLAHVDFTLTDSMVNTLLNGGTLNIGDAAVKFDTSTGSTATNSVGVKDLLNSKGKLDTTDANVMKQLIARISVAAGSNTAFTVGAGSDGKTISLQEKYNYYTGTDKTLLDTEDKIHDIVYMTGSTNGTAGALTLQIGDTAESYNQLKVSIGDMHVASEGMALSGIDISTQEGAQGAIQAIRDAINYVSGVRGDLGAVQNRLEHTANNLSVMAENIQDAESTIRDTDVAEEMMAYTKNNILVQSAQAMLAQANAVPQGVLQLLG